MTVLEVYDVFLTSGSEPSIVSVWIYVTVLEAYGVFLTSGSEPNSVRLCGSPQLYVTVLEVLQEMLCLRTSNILRKALIVVAATICTPVTMWSAS